MGGLEGSRSPVGKNHISLESDHYPEYVNADVHGKL